MNPPAKKKRSHWTFDPPRGRFPDDPDAWMASATEAPGSWWTEWNGWLAEASPARRSRHGYGYGSTGSDKAIEPAPGRYVAVRAT